MRNAAIKAFLCGCLLFFPLAAFADETLRLSRVSISDRAVNAGETVPVLIVDVLNEGESGHSLLSISVTFSVTSAADIASGSIRLIDGAGTQYGGDQSVGVGLVTFNDTVPLGPGETKRLRVECTVASNAVNGHTLTASMARPVADIGDIQGNFPLISLNEAYTIRGTGATRIIFENVPSAVAAGQSASCTVAYVNDEGVVDTNAAGGSFSFTGSANSSPLGNAPVYQAGELSAGRRSCSFTLYRAESATLQATDSSYGSAASGSISVAAGSASRVAIGTISGQAAGSPFNVTLYTADAYGNSAAGTGSVTTLSADSGIDTSPGGQSSNLPVVYTWSGGGGSGIVSVIIYNQSSAARLRASDTALGGSLSNTFTVAGAAPRSYVIAGPSTARLKTPTNYEVSLKDAWGNTVTNYTGTANCACTDTRAAMPEHISILNGRGSFSVVFGAMGNHTITLSGGAGSSLTGSIAVAVNQPPLPNRFAVTAPSSVTAGVGFIARIRALDAAGSIITEYTHPVTLSLAYNAAITPSQVTLSNGNWQGSLIISGETFNAILSVSDGDVTTSSAAVLSVRVSNFERARAYPTVFTPAAGTLRIRYFLRENRDVTVKIFNTLMDKVKEMSFPSGGAGGRQGLNVVEWDGRGGSDNAVGHSGGYRILIDKGYEEEWTGGVIKNY